MTATRKLHVVAPERHQPQPDTSYEHRERQHISARDWAALHVAADRRSPLGFFDRVRRTWR